MRGSEGTWRKAIARSLEALVNETKASIASSVISGTISASHAVLLAFWMW